MRLELYGPKGLPLGGGTLSGNLFIKSGSLLISSNIADADSTFHAYVYSGSDSPPLWRRGIVSRLGGTFAANDANTYLAINGWASMISGGFNQTGEVAGITMTGQGVGVGGNYSLLKGGGFVVVLGGSATATVMYGVHSLVANNGTANATTAYAHYSDWNKGSTGLIASVYGHHVTALPAGWGATLGAAYSCPWNSASNQYGIYMSGTVQNYMAGALTIGGVVIHTLSATPASAAAAGVIGTFSWDTNYIYICTATNTWKRVAIATW